MRTFKTRYVFKKTPIDKMSSMKVLKQYVPENSDEVEDIPLETRDDLELKEDRVVSDVKADRHGTVEETDEWTSEVDSMHNGLVEFTKYGMQLSGEKRVKGKKVTLEYPKGRELPKKEWKNKYEISELVETPAIKARNRRIDKHNGVVYDLMTTNIPSSIEPRDYVRKEAPKGTTRVVWSEEDKERINKLNERLGIDGRI